MGAGSTNREQGRPHSRPIFSPTYIMRCFVTLSKASSPFFLESDRILLAGMGKKLGGRKSLVTLRTALPACGRLI